MKTQHTKWRETYVYIANKDDFPEGRPMYSSKDHRAHGTAVIVLNAIERMMEVKK